MASSSSDIIPSILSSNEISSSHYNPNYQTQNPVPSKVNATENGVKPQPQNKKKLPTFSYPFNQKLKKPKSPKEKSPNSGEKTRESEEDAKKKREEREKEINAISNSIRADFHSIENASKRIKNREDTFKEAKEKFEELVKVANAKDLRDFKRVVKTLKQHISNQDKKDDAKEDEALVNQFRAISITNAQVANAVQLGMMPNLFADSDLERTLQFQDFKARYNELPYELKLCLLCFSVFPENVEIKRRVLIYWWIGEGFVPPRKIRPEEITNPNHWDKFNLNKISSSEKEFTPEHWANHYFKTLLNMGFIESAQKKPNPKVDICKMHPFVRSMLNRIAQKDNFFEFDPNGTVNEEFSKSLRACLLSGNILTENEKLLKNLHSIVNVDEAILDFKHDSLSKMINAHVLYLGRWQSLGTHHIEVDDTKILDPKKGRTNILDGLQNIKNLKFLSLQGISRITELPKSILKLQNLTILDIRACHNLETIPDDIGCLVNLTHLDMSECYLLDEMPKGISLLTKLQVLSGFVVLESENKKSCTLVDLKGFPDLRKLSIHTGSDKFPLEKDLKALNQFIKLSKLTIAWGRGSVNTQREYNLAKSTTLVKENEEEIKKGGSGESISGKEMTLKKENNGEIKKVGMEKQDDDHTPKKDERDGKRKNVLQFREITENTREITTLDGEINKRDKGKGIQVATRDIVESPNANIQEASSSTSRRVFSSLDIMEKDPEKNKNKKKLLSRNAKSPEQKQDLGVRFKGVLVHGLERALSRRSTSKQDHILAELPSHLTKLDLQCLPGINLNWLRPEKLLGLEKLYIRGGKLSDLGQFQDLEDGSRKRKWEKVKELRLKYLDEMEMEWRELLELFPKLDYLEKVDCPKLSFFPCDEIGVWTKKKTIS